MPPKAETVVRRYSTGPLRQVFQICRNLYIRAHHFRLRETRFSQVTGNCLRLQGVPCSGTVPRGTFATVTQALKGSIRTGTSYLQDTTMTRHGWCFAISEAHAPALQSLSPLYSLINEDKYQIFKPKITITKKDVEEIPFLKQLKEAIDNWDIKLKHTEGKDAYTIKHALIEMRKDQYVIKNAYRKPIVFNKLTHSTYRLEIPEKIFDFDDNGFPIPEGVTLLDPKCCSAILCNYSRLKQDSWEALQSDLRWLIEDFDNVSERALQDFPLYERIVECKVDGKQNIEIQKILEEEFGFTHSVEYISSLWRNKIPKLIASQAEDDYLYWYYLNIEKGKYKKCSRCGEIKLAHNKYFSKNKTSKDGFYSICKKCRNSKAKSK